MINEVSRINHAQPHGGSTDARPALPLEGLEEGVTGESRLTCKVKVKWSL
jgi:hypothetical protein